MANIDDEPIRLNTPGRYRRLRLVAVREIPLPSPSPIRTSFLTALEQRRSADEFDPIPIEELSTWLHYIAGIQHFHVKDPNRQQRYVGSLGALHPAHIILCTPNGEWLAYIPEEHVLGDLAVDKDAALKLQTKAKQYCSSANATLVVLISDRDLVENYYQNMDGLVLRDAGVLLGHAALVAAALGLAFRILGGTGAHLITQVFPGLPFRPAATGLALIGGRNLLR